MTGGVGIMGFRHLVELNIIIYDIRCDSRFFFSKPSEKNHRNRLLNTGNIFIAQVPEYFSKLECIVYSSGMVESVRMISFWALSVSFLYLSVENYELCQFNQ